ncbi:hypothetical protein [Aeromicrobium sp. PE09-221]|uniref:hypothetical protein n=1 Tax=Aeromicrobium sp. PE09-221 TaxID=1898043 RepID=UPI0014827131|nr:hypothetical protein [Aeromicrobium sp. PE09-221]
MASLTQSSLGEVLRDPGRFPWGHALYASPRRAFDDVEEDSDIPAAAAALGFEYVLVH